jgi:hypothetical protein
MKPLRYFVAEIVNNNSVTNSVVIDCINQTRDICVVPQKAELRISCQLRLTQCKKKKKLTFMPILNYGVVDVNQLPTKPRLSTNHANC